MMEIIINESTENTMAKFFLSQVKELLTPDLKKLLDEKIRRDF